MIAVQEGGVDDEEEDVYHGRYTPMIKAALILSVLCTGVKRNITGP